MNTQLKTYRDEEVALTGFLANGAANGGKRPGILVIHGGAGLDEHAKAQARRFAEIGYVAFACDMYGDGVAGNRERVMARVMELRDQPALLVRRAQAGLQVLASQPEVDGRLAAVGYCFGGMAALQLARAGVELRGVVSIHGSLKTSIPAQASRVKAKILVCHGALDPHVPMTDVSGFVEEMNWAEADWQLIVLGGALHGFTHPDSTQPMPGVRYNALADTRSFAATKTFLAELFPAVLQFESAVEAVIGGKLEMLESLLKNDPELVRARSLREHRATLLHYVAANGVEGERQKSPKNAVSVAEVLLRAGADVDALADMYGGQSTTLSMLVSSTPPAESGVQVALVETLLDFGAAIEGRGAGQWVSPLMTALAFGFSATAEVLVRRGARVDNIAAAAGLGRLAKVQELLPTSDSESRHRALALAAQHGHVEVVRVLLDAGEDPNRYNPVGNHSHSTPLHQAVAAGHLAVVSLLVERGAKLDMEDTIYHGTPLGWAKHLGQIKIAEYLQGRA